MSSVQVLVGVGPSRATAETEPWVRLTTAYGGLPPTSWPGLKARHTLRDEDVELVHYREPVVRIRVSARRLGLLLDDLEVLIAARTNMVDRMQQGGNTYSKTASRALAYEILRTPMPSSSHTDPADQELAAGYRRLAPDAALTEAAQQLAAQTAPNW